MRNPILNWLFYGHIWVALGAMALSWQTTFVLSDGYNSKLQPYHFFVFFATLGVYTLHRLLTFRRAGVRPVSRRYRLVARRPVISLVVGFGSVLAALFIGLSFPWSAYQAVFYALPFTFFYLIPLWPQGPRLRDLPYLKVVWVALAWTLITVNLPFALMLEEMTVWTSQPDGINFPIDPALQPNYYKEQVARFFFILSIALLFDTRDVVLDTEQGVKTLASTYPSLNRILAGSALMSSAWISSGYNHNYLSTGLTAIYGLCLMIVPLTHPNRNEDFYAIYVNGLLFLPPAVLAWIAANNLHEVLHL